MAGKRLLACANTYRGRALAVKQFLSHPKFTTTVPQKPVEGEQPVLLLVDTAGCEMEEVAEEGGGSTANPGEAQVICSGGTVKHANRFFRQAI